MMYRTGLTLRLAAVVLPLLLPAAARADDDDAMDIEFWRAIQNSTVPAEYQAYLDAFPHGKFAKLAALRAHQAAPAAVPAPLPTTAIPLPAAAPPARTAPAAQTAAAAPAAAADDADTADGQIVLTPATPRVGQTIRATCENFPEPSTFDKLVVVPAGTPVMDPDKPADMTKVVSFNYAVNCFRAPVTFPPLAPGAYEIRFMTRLYSNAGVVEMHAMTAFRVH
jgi:hypothetical protein